MLPRTSRFQSRPAVSAGHTSCWITERSGLPQKGTDRQVNDKTCEDKTIYSQRVVDTETYMGDGEWATGGGESARDECTPAARSAQIAQSTSCQHNKTTGEPRRHPEPWQYPPPQGRLLASPEDSPWRWWNWSMRARSRMSRAGNPASLLRTIPLPVYQVLITSAPTPNVNEPPHRIGWRPLNESGRWRGRD